MAGGPAQRDFRGTKRFRLDSLLGCGATGAVYAAYDRELRTRVALKLLTRWQAHGIAAFKQEFRSLQGIRHRNLVELRELIFDNEFWFLAMELVRGVDFLSFVRGSAGRVPVITQSWVEAAPNDETARPGTDPSAPDPRIGAPLISADAERFRSALAQLSEGLVHLHAAHRIHRDIKPSNVLVDEHGRVVIVDFGLAARTDQERSSGSSDFFGTPRYMSPEQTTGHPLGPASDWFSVGVLMFEVLTGQTPARDAKGLVPASVRETLTTCGARELSQLCQQLLADEPERRPSGEEVRSRLSVPSARALEVRPLGQRFDDESAFVGRERELQVLEAALSEVRGAKGAAVVVEGESGVGKTSLLQAFIARARAAEPSLRCFSGRCFEGESLPYKAMDAVIEAVYAELHLDRDLGPLLQRDLALVAQAFPSLQRFVAPNGEARERRAADHATPRQQREQVFTALRELFVAIAARSTLLVVLDDMQWTDKDSLALLSALSAPPDAPRMLVIVAKRPGGQELSLTQPAAVLSLGNLSEHDSESLLRTLLPPLNAPSNLHRIQELTREAHGHPLFLLELARQARQVDSTGATPVRLDDALWQRIDGLSEAGRLLLELSSVAGRPLTQDTIAEAAQLSPEAVDSGVAVQHPDALLRELRHTRLVRTSGPLPGDVVEPYHDRVREAVVARLSADTQQRRHRSLAQALMRSAAPDAEALARHWKEAGDLVTAREYAIRAARQAQSALAFDRAARLFRSSLELGPLDDARQRELRHALGDALVNAGRGAEAAEAFRVAGAGDDSLVGLHRQRLAAEHLLRSGHIESGARAMSEALRKLGLSVPRSSAAALVSLLVLRARLELRGLRYEKRRADAVSALESARIDGLWTAATCLTMFDNVRSAELQSRGILRALTAGSPLQVLRAHTAESIFVGTSGAPRAQRLGQILAAAARLAAELDDPYARGWVGLSRGATAFLLGNWQEGEEQCELAESIFQTRAGAAWELGSAKAFGTWSAMMRGRFGQVSARVPADVAEAESRGDLYAATLHMTGFSNAAWLANDDVAQARHMLGLAERRWPRAQFDVPRYLHMVAGAYIALYERNGSGAYTRVLQDWGKLRWGIAFRAQITRFGMRTVRGLAAVAAFDETRDPSLLRDASACARAIAEEGVTWSQCFAQMIEAGVAWRRGRESMCLQRLSSAEEKANATGMLLHRAVLCLRRGEVIGGTTGRALVEDGRAFMAREGIVSIDSMAALLTPTFARPGTHRA